MSYYGIHPSLKRDSEPIDSNVWHWFVCHGPHGERFNWHKETSVAPRDIEFLRKFIAERNDSDPEFSKKARIIALESLNSEDHVLVCTGIQVLTIVGTDDDLDVMKELLYSPDKTISMNARCCLFERGFKVKKKNA